MWRFIQQTLGKAPRFGARRIVPGNGVNGIPSTRQLPKPQSSFSAVAIRPDIIACDNVRIYAGKRMLEKNAPVLPVPGCDIDKCGCRYQKFADRRSGAERRLPLGGTQAPVLVRRAERAATRSCQS